MQKLSRQTIYQMAGQMSLPGEAVGLPHIDILGSGQVLLSGHRGIRSYAPSEIIVEMKDCAVVLQGSDMGIVSMTGNELLLAALSAA